MKFTGILSGLMGLLVFTSCSSVRKLSAKDSSVTTTMTKKQKGNKREFLDMEVTPGGQVANTNASSTSITRNMPKNTAVHTGSASRPVNSPTTATASTNIETAHALQLKYAIPMDATVEMLTNITLLQVIDKWWGTRYCLGGNTDSCIDCSRFTQVLLQDVYSRSLPRTAQEQYDAAEKVALEDLKEGDLVFFNTGGRGITHVGVYLLNNKFVHASTSGGVMISDLNDTYWQPKYRGAGRAAAGLEIQGSK
jgi:cell wall-associated NlpC family hydrolase